MAACETPTLTQSAQAICQPRAQWEGAVRLMCPRCGKIGVYRVNFGGYKLRCVNNKCRKRWSIGLVIREIDMYRDCGPGTKQMSPIDTVFPTCDLEPLPWRSGDPIHKLIITSEMQESQPAHTETAPESSE